MKKLSIVLIVKISVTILLWGLPLLIFPVQVFQALGFPELDPLVFIKLLGMAYLALVVGYWFGLQEVRRNKYPDATVWVGIVSNGGAAIILAVYGFSNAWQNWGTFAQIFMWMSMVATAGITGGLIMFGVLGSR